jgi:hypothetical protein
VREASIVASPGLFHFDHILKSGFPIVPVCHYGFDLIVSPQQVRLQTRLELQGIGKRLVQAFVQQ